MNQQPTLRQLEDHFNAGMDQAGINITNHIRVRGNQRFHRGIITSFFRWSSLAGKYQLRPIGFILTGIFLTHTFVELLAYDCAFILVYWNSLPPPREGFTFPQKNARDIIFRQ